MDLITTILPVVTKDLPISPRFTPYNFLSRCKFSTLTTRQPMVEFYLLTFPRFPLRKKEHKSYLGKNRTHDFRTSRCAAYLLDHSGVIDHFTRFAALVALPDNKEQTIAKALVERVFGIFGSPKTLHSDQGPEFENKAVKQLQDVFGYKKTKTTPYRPQGKSV